jgi:hypothetical protein
MTECPNCGRCCGYDEDGRLVCICGYHEEYDVSNWTPQEDLPLGPSRNGACNQFIRRRRALVRRDVLTPPASTPAPGAGR